MVLELILSVVALRRHPFNMLFLSFLLSSIALFVSYYTFPESSSILALAFVTIALMPIIERMLVEEEEEEAVKPGSPGSFLARHFDLVEVYAWFFIGLVLSYGFWYAVLPATAPASCITDASFQWDCILPAKDKVFAEQEKTWSVISGWQSMTGKITGFVGIGPESCLGQQKELLACTEFIYLNNSFVLVLAIFFSILWGAGAVFLLGWNASVIGLFIGKEALSGIGPGVQRAISYLPHGIPEVSGYFIGAIAGGIISALVTKRRYKRHELSTIAMDAFVLICLAFIILFIGALIEAWLIVG
ncbi:MAG: stage II sporulation protein M [Candidatus Diapherotrites archaeon]